jgi:hypothetical protein
LAATSRPATYKGNTLSTSRHAVLSYPETVEPARRYNKISTSEAHKFKKKKKTLQIPGTIRVT